MTTVTKVTMTWVGGATTCFTQVTSYEPAGEPGGKVSFIGRRDDGILEQHCFTTYAGVSTNADEDEDEDEDAESSPA